MKKVVMVLVVVLVAASAFAGGAACDAAKAAKAVKLAGTISCANGDCSNAQLIADADHKYTICKSSKVKLTSLNGTKVKVSGKLVKCSEGGGEELVVESLSKI
jgi:hypothetical protein